MKYIIRPFKPQERHLTRLFSLSLVILMGFAMISCSDDPDEPIGDDRSAVTSVTWTLVPEVGSIPVTISWEDLDFNGPGAPTKVSGTLAANTSYTGSLSLTNESVSPSINKNQEILADPDLYQLFFQTPANIRIGYADEDDDGNPIGLQNTVTTLDAGSGTVNLSLRFALDKNADGAAQGSAGQVGGAIDLQAELDYMVQ